MSAQTRPGPLPSTPKPTPKSRLDRALHARQARITGGLSPTSLTLAWMDWAAHLANSPGKLGELTENAAGKGWRYASWVAARARDDSVPPIIEPLPQDRRFRGEAWQQFPFNLMYQGFLMAEQWWHYATTDVPGVSLHHQDMVSFTARQLLDVASPSNFPLTNPEVLEATVEESGENLRRGFEHFVEDLQAHAFDAYPEPPEGFSVGGNLAATPGKVIYRNPLMELIQYEPTTARVHPEPVLVIPAWIMKYYILDLSAHNSLVRYLVDQGHTVFMVSWKNPGPEDRELAMSDYLEMGVMAALDAVAAVRPGRSIHAAGYCLGGTLLTMAAAAMARDGDERIGSLSLFASQMDFTEAGELKLFIDEGQLAFLSDVMWDRGYLDSREMAGAFQLLRSNDLIWSRMVREYLLGTRQKLNDLMAWNLDATRMPYRMHSEYLRTLYLHNDLAGGRFQVGGRPVAISDIRAPVFMVGTASDHVAPWKSVYKAHLLVDTDLTFVLAAGGHNAGIVSEPGHPRRHYQLALNRKDDQYMDPQEWVQSAPRTEGSWWPAWEAWLANGSGRKVRPPAMGAEKKEYAALADAPGEYVLMQ